MCVKEFRYCSFVVQSKAHQVIAQRVKELRKARGWSADKLAQEMTNAGIPWERMVVTKLENGRRAAVTVEEWLTLGYVLDVPPPMLFLDLAAGTPVELYDGQQIHPWLAWQWITGDEPPTSTERMVIRPREYVASTAEIRLYRREGAAARDVERNASGLALAERAGNEEKEREWTMGYLEALRTLAMVLDEMVDQKMTPPGKPREWIEEIRNMGLSNHPDELVVFPDPGGDDGSR